MQLALVIAIVAGCCLMLLRGAARSLRGKKTAGCAECPAVDRRPPAGGSRAA